MALVPLLLDTTLSLSVLVYKTGTSDPFFTCPIASQEHMTNLTKCLLGSNVIYNNVIKYTLIRSFILIEQKGCVLCLSPLWEWCCLQNGHPLRMLCSPGTPVLVQAWAGNLLYQKNSSLTPASSRLTFTI